MSSIFDQTRNLLKQLQSKATSPVQSPLQQAYRPQPINLKPIVQRAAPMVQQAYQAPVIPRAFISPVAAIATRNNSKMSAQQIVNPLTKGIDAFTGTKFNTLATKGINPFLNEANQSRQRYANDQINSAQMARNKVLGLKVTPEQQLARSRSNENMTQAVAGMISGPMKNLKRSQVELVKNSFNANVRDKIGQWAIQVESGKLNKADPLNDYVYSLGESVFGKQAAHLSPKQLLNALDVVQQEALKIKGYRKLNIGLSTGSVREGKVKVKGAEAGVGDIADLAKMETVPRPQLNQAMTEGTTALKQPTRGVLSRVDSSSPDIIPQEGRVNVDRLNLSDEGKAVVKQVDTNQKTVIGNKEVIDQARLTEGRRTPMTDEQQQQILASRLNSRQKVVTLTKEFEDLKKSGADQETLIKKMSEIKDQTLIVNQEKSFAGRQLQAQNIMADELATPMQKVLAMLDNAGIPAEKYLKDAANVDWNNSKQVVRFYRKYVKGTFGEYLTEFRYTNMLSSPLTHIVNTASNLVQTAVIAPIEKTISGALDLGKSALTGSERQYYVSDGIKYAKGYYGSLPQAVKKFAKTISGAEINIKPDMERIPVSTGKAWNIYTLPLKALEGADQFFMTLVKGGEKASLKGRGSSEADIAVKAQNSAQYRLFRQKFDPTGELGNGYVLRTWDKYNSVIQQLRRVPGGNWIVPFLQTPTNLLKQGVEYSPLGITTIPGSKRPIEQLSKTIIGSTVFAGSYALLLSTPFTWSVPTGKKERELFYAAGMQPYSIKVGDKWVSYSKLGPLSYPIAMAAALRYAEKYDLPNDQKSAIATAAGGMLQFFSDQSYVKNLGDFVDAVSTGQGFITGAQQELTNMATQLIPYKSFLGWMSRMIDPVNRKSEGVVGGIASQLPFVSKTQEAYFNPATMQPSQRSNPILNSFSPYRITTGDQDIENRFNYTGSAKRAYTNIMRLPEDQRAAMFDKIKQDSPAMAREIVNLANEVQQGVTGEDKKIKNLGVNERAYTIANEFNKLKTQEEKAALWDHYVKTGIITADVAKQLGQLLNK